MGAGTYTVVLRMLVLVVLVAGEESTHPVSAPGAAGTAKDAWPELVGLKSTKAVEELRVSGLVKNVRVWGPSFTAGSQPARASLASLVEPDDVWVYTDQNDIVYEIPRRGPWHPNRVYPGWIDLLGKDLNYAIDTIVEDFFGVTVKYVPDGYLDGVKPAYTRDRVYVQYNKQGKVSRIPLLF